jgi:hypothetical protein
VAIIVVGIERETGNDITGLDGAIDWTIREGEGGSSEGVSVESDEMLEEEAEDEILIEGNSAKGFCNSEPGDTRGELWCNMRKLGVASKAWPGERG